MKCGAPAPIRPERSAGHPRRGHLPGYKRSDHHGFDNEGTVPDLGASHFPRQLRRRRVTQSPPPGCLRVHPRTDQPAWVEGSRFHLRLDPHQPTRCWDFPVPLAPYSPIARFMPGFRDPGRRAMQNMVFAFVTWFGSMTASGSSFMPGRPTGVYMGAGIIVVLGVVYLVLSRLRITDWTDRHPIETTPRRPNSQATGAGGCSPVGGCARTGQVLSFLYESPAKEGMGQWSTNLLRSC